MSAALKSPIAHSELASFTKPCLLNAEALVMVTSNRVDVSLRINQPVNSFDAPVVRQDALGQAKPQASTAIGDRNFFCGPGLLTVLGSAVKNRKPTRFLGAASASPNQSNHDSSDSRCR
jgi:hypothetical protein